MESVSSGSAARGSCPPCPACGGEAIATRGLPGWPLDAEFGCVACGGSWDSYADARQAVIERSGDQGGRQDGGINGAT